MAKCKLCKKNIPDSSEYCKDCLDKRKSKSNESYLDSLLDSVKSKAPNTESIYKNNRKVEEYESEVAENRTIEQNLKDDISEYDSIDLKDFDEFNFEDDLADFDDEIIIEDEDLFGEALTEVFSNQDQGQNKVVDDMNEKSKVTAAEISLDNDILEEAAAADDSGLPGDISISELSAEPDEISPLNKKKQADEIILPNESDLIDFTDQSNEDERLTISGGIPINASDDILPEEDDRNRLEIQNNEMDNNEIDNDEIDNNEIDNDRNDKLEADINYEPDIPENAIAPSEMFEDEDYDTDLNDLLDKLDIMQEDDQNIHEEIEISNQANSMKNIEENSQSEENSNNGEIGIKEDNEEDNILSLLNQISSDDPVVDDVKAINDLMNGGMVNGNDKDMPSNVGEVFADALKAVSSLNDPNLNEEELLSKIPGAKEKKKKKRKKSKSTSANENGEENGNKKQRKSLWQLLFGNVKDKKAAKKTSGSSDINEDDNTADLQKKDTDKKSKKAKKGSKPAGEDLKETEKQSKKNAKKKASAEKKSKKKEKINSREIIQVIDEIDEDETRINRLGASIVFIFFGLLATLLIVGTNTVSYTLSIQHATSYFDKKKYTQAYYEVYGMEIKDEDIEIYEKIKTVMFVNKQLNSYNNYTALNEYPQALDSLLKGLKRYDKYIELATMLGIRTDMDYVREQILAELKKEFKLSEKEALKMTHIDNMKDYSMKVYDVVAENKKK